MSGGAHSIVIGIEGKVFLDDLFAGGEGNLHRPVDDGVDALLDGALDGRTDEHLELGMGLQQGDVVVDDQVLRQTVQRRDVDVEIRETRLGRPLDGVRWRRRRRSSLNLHLSG